MSGILAQDDGGPLMSEDKFESSFAGIFDDDFQWSFMEFFCFLGGGLQRKRWNLCSFLEYMTHVFLSQCCRKAGKVRRNSSFGDKAKCSWDECLWDGTMSHWTSRLKCTTDQQVEF